MQPDDEQVDGRRWQRCAAERPGLRQVDAEVWAAIMTTFHGNMIDVLRSIIGAEVMAQLRAAGFRIVPEIATIPMRNAATKAMVRRRQALGDDCPWVSNSTKANIRWEAMLKAWDGDSQ
jgi:hypothetical protein